MVIGTGQTLPVLGKRSHGHEPILNANTQAKRRKPDPDSRPKETNTKNSSENAPSLESDYRASGASSAARSTQPVGNVSRS